MNQPRTITEPRQWAEYCRRQRADGMSIGFVPTMGALHSGHAALIRRSARENDVALASIFVNPTQFNDQDDLSAYPRTLEADLQLAAELGVKAVFLPTRESIYPDGFDYRVEEARLGHILEGEHRPGHFNGVLTIVLKLLLLTAADRAYFGEKDYQQYALIRGMAEAFFLRETLGTEIVLCPIVREHSGLALSSRNARLSDEGRRTAPLLSQILQDSPDAAAAAEELQRVGFRVEYVTDTDSLSPGHPRRLAAVVLEGVRLIDTIPLTKDVHHGE